MIGQSSINDLNNPCDKNKASTSSNNDLNLTLENIASTSKKKQTYNPYINYEADESNSQSLSGSESEGCDTGSMSSFIDDTNYETNISFYRSMR